MLDFLSVLLNGRSKLFQSINFINGSQQKTHSDSIHMTTYPLGGLLGVWIALEDVDETNGALHYIPKSHKLPYFLNSDYDNEGTAFKIGKKSYRAYEAFLEDKVKELGLKKKFLRLKKEIYSSGTPIFFMVVNLISIKTEQERALYITSLMKTVYVIMK